MNLGLTGKVVLITGGSGDVGSAAASAFAREGARVAITYHDSAQRAGEIADEIVASGAEAFTTPLDLADPASIDRAVASVVDRWGAIHVLVTAALRHDVAPAWGVPFDDQPLAEWQDSLRANLEGTMATVRAVVPSMRKQGWGRIVLIAANALVEGVPGREAYASGKAGLYGLARSLAASVGPAGILVNGVALSLALTDKTRRFVPPAVVEGYQKGTPTGRLSEPAEIADAIVFLASAANRNIAGTFLPVTGGR